jgi:hypothetical protein
MIKEDAYLVCLLLLLPMRKSLTSYLDNQVKEANI